MVKKEYIEREALIELVKHLDKNERCKNCYHLASCDSWVRNATTLYDDYIYSVENCPYHIPDADVVEVRHGEWIWTEDGTEDYEQYWICSCCGDKDYIEYNYCPNCGAKMDGKGE